MSSGITARRSDCAVASTLDIVGDKWSLLVVRDLLLAGELRYGDLAAADESMPTSTLADRLRRLEEAGIVQRLAYSDRPPRYSYRLTDRGRGLGAVVDAMAEWGVANLDGVRRRTPADAGGA